MKRRVVLLGLAAGGCSLAPTAPPVVVYDLGPPPGAAATAPALRVLPVVAPAWLDGPGIAYRLEAADGLRRELYRDSRWAAPPAALLQQRVQERVAPAGTGPALALHLDEFVQVFAASGRSRGVLRLRARVLNAAGDVMAARLVAVERDAPTADARGGARALAQAADEAVDQVLAWVTSLPR